MTAGFHPANPPAIHPRDDREALSALFDGELSADAVRFALKRLDHDAGWREACGRWQLIGDALRGQVALPAPTGFAAGVMQALALEARAAAAVAQPAVANGPGQPRVPPARRRWIGGAALAATVAMATVLVVRPFSAPSDTGSGVRLSTAPATARPANTASAADPAAAAPATATAFPRSDAPAARRVARIDPPAPASRGARASRPAAPSRAAQTRPAEGVSGGAPVTAVAAIPVPSAPSQQPFHPPADPIATRPWPRAVLPDAGSGALTVGFGNSTAPAPSFYPFEPRLSDSAAPSTEAQPR